jgi:hypothetical protein
VISERRPIAEAFDYYFAAFEPELGPPPGFDV